MFLVILEKFCRDSYIILVVNKINKRVSNWKKERKKRIYRDIACDIKLFPKRNWGYLKHKGSVENLLSLARKDFSTEKKRKEKKLFHS